MLAKTDGHRGKSVLDVQNQCLLRVVDTRAQGFVITNPMLAKSERHESKPSAVVMTKAVLAKSERPSASINSL